MFNVLQMYGADDGANLYATQMHSDSGYLVTNGSGKASYGGFLTWDDHPVKAAREEAQLRDLQGAQQLRAVRLHLQPPVNAGRTLSQHPARHAAVSSELMGEQGAQQLRAVRL
eukprot:CAMPEP_0180343278 /NCGR_PEP_ID=MMETSP0989-20121125/2201_1 /TAXON_ID=697907 /ORGANISM="non described non described, Strain CCMP2293" /LENGTH=112 /DNA_ID=CAMNT_0022332225 /DNA_START=20 /DNA_END=354 /DNA_ORIENTATION=-